MITPKKIFQFFEGNLRMLGDEYFYLPRHLREQVAWRSEICKNDCMKDGACIKCGCSVPGKLYVRQSCNQGERFPDLMKEEEWDEYKIKNNIEIKL